MLTCRTEKDAKADEAYFDSYGYFDIHRTMLGDEVRHHSDRCLANFQAAILKSTWHACMRVLFGIRHAQACCHCLFHRFKRVSKPPSEGQIIQTT